MMQYPENIVIKRECTATEIPSGRKILLYPGTEVRLMQALGGTFTVQNYQGLMASIAGQDADALGKEIPEEIKKLQESQASKTPEDLVWDYLRTCYDPEIPHNIVDLGLIYQCKVEELPESAGDKKVYVQMTLTAPGCGMGDWLKADIQNKLSTIPTIKEINVEMTFDPPWTPAKMHPALRRSMGI